MKKPVHKELEFEDEFNYKYTTNDTLLAPIADEMFKDHIGALKEYVLDYTKLMRTSVNADYKFMEDIVNNRSD